MTVKLPSERLSKSQKNKNKFAWYKEKADYLDSLHNRNTFTKDGKSLLKKMQVNYDLFNNKLNLEDLDYVCNPYGGDKGELPASMTNKDIVSGKIKVVLGMEMKKPLEWNVIATNKEATTRKEQEEYGRLRDYVISQIVTPIRQQIEVQKQQELAGQELTPEDEQRIMQEIEQEMEAMTPEEVKLYMKRDHQDPSEVMTSQLLNYLMQKQDIPKKFNTAFKHGLLSAVQAVYVGVLNGEPRIWNVNSKRITYDDSPDLTEIESGQYVVCEYLMTPSEIISHFGSELDDDEIDRIFAQWGSRKTYNEDDLFSLEEGEDTKSNTSISVIHSVWKSLRKIGFLTYEDETGEIQEKMVDEDYELNTDFGDIEIEWEWYPENYETWKIKVADPIYKKMRPIPGQFKDLENLHDNKLPYYGVVYDNMNSEPTSLMDRLINFQYYYNIIMYRLELLLASDKGKKVLMNMGSIPTSAGIDLETWQYFFEATPFMWYDPSEEGNNYNDVNTVAKVVDLSVASDIQKYIEAAMFIKREAGYSVGITEQVEGQIGPNEAVSNTRQNLLQTSHILEVYFDLHNHFKKNVMNALIEAAKVAYADSANKKLSYVLDDLSIETFTLDTAMLENSTLGLFIANSAKAEEIKNMLRELTHAAMQNQKVELSDVISVLEKDNITEAKEVLLTAEENRRSYEQEMQQQEIQARQEEAENEREFLREEHKMEKEKIILKEKERRKTIISQTALVGMSFNPEVDTDKDGVNDFLEIARDGVAADIKMKELELKRDELEHKKTVDARKDRVENKKLAIEKAKQAKKATKT